MADVHKLPLSKQFEDPITVRIDNFNIGPKITPHLSIIEQALGVTIDIASSNSWVITGEQAAKARTVLYQLKDKAREGEDITVGLVQDLLGAHEDQPRASLATERKLVWARNLHQVAQIRAMEDHDLTFVLGPAGTGKTYLAVAMAVAMLKARRCDRIILSRPAVEAGERLGFLPGDLKDKVDPYMRPLYDGLQDMLPEGKLQARIDNGTIEIAPLAYMRGRTLSNAFVILDEAQNTTPAQMKMFLTRMGENCKMVITGDVTQIDLPVHAVSGLADAVKKLRGLLDVGVINYDKGDVVRHPLVGQIVDCYEQAEAAAQAEAVLRTGHQPVIQRSNGQGAPMPT